MPLKMTLLALAILLAPPAVSAQPQLPHGALDIEGLPNRYARRAFIFHRHRAARLATQLSHGLLEGSDKSEKIREKTAAPWDEPKPGAFEKSFVVRLAKVFIDTLPAGGSEKWALRLKVILE